MICVAIICSTFRKTAWLASRGKQGNTNHWGGSYSWKYTSEPPILTSHRNFLETGLIFCFNARQKPTEKCKHRARPCWCKIIRPTIKPTHEPNSTIQSYFFKLSLCFVSHMAYISDAHWISMKKWASVFGWLTLKGSPSQNKLEEGYHWAAGILLDSMELQTFHLLKPPGKNKNK